MNEIQFEVGENYENMKGIYEVLSINGNTMRIRWKSGGEITTTVALQSRIIMRMRRQQEREG